ncbi:MmcQ/YjbR family DNA-binding protein [Mucilaginibacter sp. AW1-7]|uniref:MmcQ/YjbR family DNA-binding protein n=1 Tax=Mucilaginibacter sp. AW1-7 TaxID=3349874 RepID=UPI003F739006
MTIETLQSICHQLPGVTEDIKLDHHLCFNVGGKTFLFTGPDSVPVTASVKVPDEDFEETLQKECFSPQAYIGCYKWVHIADINCLSNKAWEFYIKQSYRLIADKLPARVKKQLNTGGE